MQHAFAWNDVPAGGAPTFVGVAARLRDLSMHREPSMPSSLSSLKNAARHMFGMPGEKAQAPAQAKPGKSHSLTGFLGGLTSRARPGGNKVHPEPMSMPPRAAMPRPPGRPGSPVHQAAPAAQTAQPAMASQPYAPRVPPWRDVPTQTASRPTSSPRPQPAVRPAPQMSAAERAGNAELDAARAVVAEGRPDLHKMYTEAMECVDRNNRINQNSTLLEPEDRQMEYVDFAAIDKDYDRKLARFDKAAKTVDAAADAGLQARNAERQRQAALDNARAVVAEGPPDLYKMYSAAMERVENNNRTNKLYGSLLKPEDRREESVDFPAVDKDYQQKLARYEQARAAVDAAAPRPSQAAAAGPAPHVEVHEAPRRQPVAPHGVHAGSRPQPTAATAPAARTRPAPGGTENAKPDAAPMTQRAMLRKNMQPFVDSFRRGDMDRDFEPKHLVAAMTKLAEGTKYEKDVSIEMARNPDWGQQMRGNWNALRQAVDNARQEGRPDVRSLEQIVGDGERRAAFVRFLATGRGMNRLLRQEPAVQPKVPAGQASRPAGSNTPSRVAQPQAPVRAPSTARAGNAELDSARAVVAEGPPDLHKMYSEAMERVDRNNRINQNSTLLEPEDRVMEHVDFAAIDKDYDRKLARFEKASKIVDAAANPAQARAQAAAFQAEVRAEARSMAERAYHADVREARDIVRQGPVSYDQVEGWARADARQNYTTVGSERLDYDAIVRDYDRIKERFEAAEQLLSRPLTGEETAARMDAQMAEAERRVRQRQEGAGTRR
jgi:hypothetical protein